MDMLLMEEIPNNHLGFDWDLKNPVYDGINLWTPKP